MKGKKRIWVLLMAMIGVYLNLQAEVLEEVTTKGYEEMPANPMKENKIEEGKGTEKRVKGIPKISLSISDTKWVYLKFHSNVKYVDCGTDDIFTEKTHEESILRIKCFVPEFEETSMTVITLEGQIYTFALHYHQNPQFIAVDMKGVKDYTIKESDAISPYLLELSDFRTSHILLEDRIVDIAVGIDSIEAEDMGEITNICRARKIGEFDYFSETSLTIITEKKEVIPFLVTHNDNPKDLNINISSTDINAQFSQSTLNEMEMERLGKNIAEKGMQINNLGIYRQKMMLGLAGVYIKDNILMFHIIVGNESKIDFNVDFIKSYIINSKTFKSSSSQEDEIKPMYVYRTDKEGSIKAKESYSEILFFPKFTIPEKNQLYFELFEKGGGRHLKFKCDNKLIYKAERIK